MVINDYYCHRRCCSYESGDKGLVLFIFIVYHIKETNNVRCVDMQMYLYLERFFITILLLHLNHSLRTDRFRYSKLLQVIFVGNYYTE